MNSALIAALIGAIAQHGPQLIHEIIDLVHGNPQQQGETEDAYIARLNSDIDLRLADADKKAQSVIDDLEK